MSRTVKRSPGEATTLVNNDAMLAPMVRVFDDYQTIGAAMILLHTKDQRIALVGGILDEMASHLFTAEVQTPAK